MSDMSGAIVVVRSAGHTLEEACDALVPALQPGYQDARWEVKSRSEDGSEASIDPDSTEFFSMLNWRRTAHGFDVLTLRVDVNALTDDSGIGVIQSFLWTALAKLGAVFGYLTDYDYQLTAEWIDLQVLAALQDRDYSRLAEPTFRLLLYSRELFEEAEPYLNWTAVREGPEGVLLAR